MNRVRGEPEHLRLGGDVATRRALAVRPSSRTPLAPPRAASRPGDGQRRVSPRGSGAVLSVRSAPVQSRRACCRMPPITRAVCSRHLTDSRVNSWWSRRRLLQHHPAPSSVRPSLPLRLRSFSSLRRTVSFGALTPAPDRRGEPGVPRRAGSRRARAGPPARAGMHGMRDAEVRDQAPQHGALRVDLEQVDDASHVIDQVAVTRKGHHREGLLEAPVEIVHLDVSRRAAALKWAVCRRFSLRPIYPATPFRPNPVPGAGGRKF